jgi:hypothetical protein
MYEKGMMAFFALTGGALCCVCDDKRPGWWTFASPL